MKMKKAKTVSSFEFRASSKNSFLMTRNSRLATRASQRRGILLLVVLGLLTLFLFIGTAFVISSNQFRLANRSYQQAGNQENIATTQHNFLDEVLNQLVRDTNNQNSALRYHSLLRDLYGTQEGVIATVDTGTAQFARASSGLPDVTGSQFLELQFRTNPYRDLNGNSYSQDTPPVGVIQQPLPVADHAWSGRLLTFIDGPAACRTTRIVGYFNNFSNDGDPTNDWVVIRIVNFPGRDGQLLTLPSVLDGSQFVINGRPFNGTGAGYNPNPALATNDPKLSALETVNGSDLQIALMPNAAFFAPQFVTGTGAANYFSDKWASLNATQQQNLMNGIGFEGQGGSDESYDAADFQNMFLAWSPPGPQATVIPNNPPTVPGTPSLGTMVLPSFHRPALINYWANQVPTLGSDATNASLLRKVMLRPNWWDHPNFTGSNSYLEGLTPDQRLLRMIYGPWDVDNDRDGVPDSVWVDFGAPIIAGPNGKLVKPLAAILVLDMDGRLNVNAHSTREIQNPRYTNFRVPLAGGVSSNQAPQGQAFGVAEIDLRPVLQGRFGEVLFGDTINGTRYPGRYADDDEPGQKDIFDLSAQLKMQGMPATNLQMNRTLYGSLPDYSARYVLGLNDFGQAIHEGAVVPSEAGHFLDADNPYELNLSATGPRGVGTSVDNPYSLAELERVLRAFDIDSPTLPPRLHELLTNGSVPGINQLNEWRTLLTTDSYDLPEPGFQMPEWVNTGIPAKANSDYFSVMGRPPVNATFADLIEYRIRAAQTTPWNVATDTPARINALRTQMSVLIAPEMMAGLKLDLNRPLGNGRDDNIAGQPGFGVIDEPGEFNDIDTDEEVDPGEERALWFIDETRAGISASPPTNDLENPTFSAYHDAIDRDADGDIEPWEWGDTDENGTLSQIELVNLHNYRRQLLARHLYTMALAVVDPFDLTTTDGKAKTRQLAQWAINAVDFRDPDNIMTAFEYDANPFDGWQVDGDLNTNDWAGADGNPGTNDDIGGVVWGLEQPELLMTEALAWHDRRTTDTASEAVDPSRLAPPKTEAGSVEDTDPSKRDPDLDSQYRPLGATFIELYNPSAASPGASADTHAIQGLNYDTTDPSVNMPGVAPGTDLGINLAAVAVDPMDNTRRSPVWRIQVVHKRKKNATNTAFIDDYSQRLLFFDPDDQSTLTGVQRPDVDRTIYFAQGGSGFNSTFPNNAPILENNYQSIDSNDGVEFYTTQVIRPVRPGTYMVVGGGVEKTPGSNVFQSPVGLTYHPSDLTKRNKIGRRIELHPQVSLTGNSPTLAPVQMFNPPANSPLPFTTPTLVTPKLNNQYVADVAIINRVIDRSSSGVVQGPADRSFSLSEPASGYPNQILGSVWTTNTPAGGPEVEGWYVRADNLNVPQPVDIPLDNNDNVVQAVDPDVSTYGTVQGYRWLYLQRLANPLLPFNPEPGQPGHNPNRAVNPYRTIDHSSVNLSVFNGMINSAIVTPDLNPEYGSGPEENRLSSLERGWKNDPKDLTQTNYPAQSDTRMKTNPFHVENSGLRPRDNSVFPVGSDHYFNAMPDATIGFLNRSFNQDFVVDRTAAVNGATPNPLNVPDRPFPWLTWNNRPFANPGELMQVPAVRSSQVTRAHTFLDPASSDNNLQQEVYQGQINSPPPNSGNPFYNLFQSQFTKQDGPFGHLMNFFRTRVDTANKGIVGLYRVLDLVEVPSRYVGTETWLNPATFGQPLADHASLGPPDKDPRDPRYGWQPPFNRLPTRREPGKVNINTITNRDVWNGIIHDSDHFGRDDDEIWPSRRGYSATGSDPTVLSNESPTLFANPFRSSGTGDHVPLPQLLRYGLDSTLLRSSMLPDLAAFSGTVPQPDDDPRNVSSENDAFRNPDRNPYFRYTPISRLSSMTTTRSNVFAVWITVGFFEVEEAPDWASNETYPDGVTQVQTVHPSIDTYRRAYPEGYMFTKEAGSDTGDFTRVRKFAIVDRTIPVGFQPGANHNVKETIRLKREIE